MTTASRRFELGAELRDGEFVRQPSVFRRWVRAGDRDLPAEPGRYHLYVSAACPWAHRTLIVRQLKGLQDVITVSGVHPFRDARGWAFDEAQFVDSVNQFGFLSEAYRATDSRYDGRYSVPVLWDRAEKQIVNNESADIIEMLNDEFDEWARHPDVDLYPSDQRVEIDRLSDFIYERINDGVYRTGFAASQRAYDAAFDRLFTALDELDALLAGRRYLAGDRPTLADWRLFPTLLRFDVVYYVHFRCNGRRIADFANLWPYVRELYQWPGVAATVDFAQIKTHYYTTHDSLNPKRIVPRGPLDLDLDEPHGRG